jgi:hypothetical protein
MGVEDLSGTQEHFKVEEAPKVSSELSEHQETWSSFDR